MNNFDKSKNKKNLYSFFMMSFAMLFILFAVPSCTTKGVYTNAVRLHVIANSDSDIDQSIKLAVRDQIVYELFEPLKETANSNESYKYLKENASNIEAIANKVLLNSNFAYSAKVDIGIHTYPTRMYETATLPAGDYRSVKVILGDGKGKNWWCVVYPPMCVDISEDENSLCETLSDGNTLENNQENKENEEEIVFKSTILDKLGVQTPQPNENAKKRLLSWLR